MTRNQFYTPIGRHLARPIRSTAALQKMDSLRAQIHTNPGALLFIPFIDTAFHESQDCLESQSIYKIKTAIIFSYSPYSTFREELAVQPHPYHQS